jgi:putative heme-binding domain-containing protein
VRQLLTQGDTVLADRVRAQWGALRTDRDPQREEVIAQMRTFLRHTPGDPQAGQEVFNRVCGQCHKLHGNGQEVGPDITLNGRSSFEQLLSNVFDPSLVIGASYQARTVVTTDGRVLSGLLAEDGPQRVVLKTQGGKRETIARSDIEEINVSRLSLMPEEVEKQLKPQELADLFAVLTLDKPASDPSARKLPGSQPVVPRATADPAKFAELVAEVAPGFSIAKTGKPGLEIVAVHADRAGVLLVRPVNQREPTVFCGEFDIPAGKRTRLVLAISHPADRAWKLTARADGVSLHDAIVGGPRAVAAWKTVSLDLAPLAGKRAKLELAIGAVGDSLSPAYIGQAEIVSD